MQPNNRTCPSSAIGSSYDFAQVQGETSDGAKRSRLSQTMNLAITNKRLKTAEGEHNDLKKEEQNQSSDENMGGENPDSFSFSEVVAVSGNRRAPPTLASNVSQMMTHPLQILNHTLNVGSFLENNREINVSVGERLLHHDMTHDPLRLRSVPLPSFDQEVFFHRSMQAITPGQQFFGGDLSALQQVQALDSQSALVPLGSRTWQPSLWPSLNSTAALALCSSVHAHLHHALINSATFLPPHIAPERYRLHHAMISPEQPVGLFLTSQNLGRIPVDTCNGPNMPLSPIDGFPLCLPFPLALSDDVSSLSHTQVLLRLHIEVFQATENDANTHARGRNKPVNVGQVGIRCKHCKHRPIHQRQKGSTYFPNSLMGIYQAAQNMSSVHLKSGRCTEIPEEVKQQFVQIMFLAKEHQSGSGRHYWAKAAKKLGLVDTEKDGIRFIRDLPMGARVVEITTLPG